MKAFAFRTLTIVALASTTSASPAGAQDAPGARAPDKAESRAIEVTPFVSIDSRGSTPIGAAISFPLGASLSIESEVGYRRGEGGMNALSSSANLLYDLPRLGRATPYVATGVGLAQYGTPVVTREHYVIGSQPRIAVEVNAGAGLKVPVDDKWGMRTDARWYKSFGISGSEHFRVSQGVSFGVKKR